MKWLRKRRFDPEIAPDEIFLDSSNAPAFDRTRFEGRIEQPLSSQTFTFFAAGFSVIFLVLALRAGELQLAQGSSFAAESERNSLSEKILFAPRGVIEDAAGVPLAENVEKEDGSISRRYPVPELGQIIGYVSLPKKDSSGRYYDTSITGITGIEQELDGVLSGRNGKLLIETDALGVVRSEGTVVRPEPGATVRLTIDAELERALASAIASIARDKGFIAGAGVVMDVESGAVRALVSYPAYDPAVMSEGAPAAEIARYAKDPGRPFLDHVVQGVYAPGSIVKPFIAAGALTDGLITPVTIIDDPGVLVIPNPYYPDKPSIFRGWKALGPMDVRKAIAWSSDVFFYTVGGGFGNQKGLGIERLKYWYNSFGMGIPTGIALPNEAAGRIPTPAWKEEVFGDPWRLGDTYFTSIGQYAVQVTPIQMARATASLVNGGFLPVPLLRADQRSQSSKVPVDADALRVVREGMRMTVTEALAGALNVPYVSAAAKTGTAQVGTRNQYDNSWVVGFFPYERPRYSFAVVLERGPEGTGSQAVNVMRVFFDTLHAADSPYLAGGGPALLAVE